MHNPIYLSPPFLNGHERELLIAAIDSNWIAPEGPHLKQFDEALARYAGVPAACAVNSGTSALHLGLDLLGVGSGQDVFCPSITFVASANPIVYRGAQPVFVDCHHNDMHMDPALLDAAIQDRIRQGRKPGAVIWVHLYGAVADVAALQAVCSRYNIPVLEDAAEAMGGTWQGQAAGTFGRVGIYSFNGNKMITTSAGGCVLSQDEELVARAAYLATQARELRPYHQHAELGYNYRLSNVLAALGLAQLAQVEDFITRRRRIYQYYADRLGRLPGVGFQAEDPGTHHSRWITVLTLDPAQTPITAEAIRAALEAERIQARNIWRPLHLQPIYQNAPFYGPNNAERLFHQMLCLPSGPQLTEAQLDRICGIIEGVFAAATAVR